MVSIALNSQHPFAHKMLLLNHLARNMAIPRKGAVKQGRQPPSPPAPLPKGEGRLRGAVTVAPFEERKIREKKMNREKKSVEPVSGSE